MKCINKVYVYLSLPGDEDSLVVSGGGDDCELDEECEDGGTSDIRGNERGVSSNSAQPPLRPISTTLSSIRVNSSFLHGDQCHRP